MRRVGSIGTAVRARAGDVVVVHEHHCGGTDALTYDTFELGVVTSVSWRRARAWRPAWAETGSLPIPAGCQRLWIVSADQFDVPQVLRAARGHAWPSGGAAAPYASLAEVQAAVRPCRKGPVPV
jgi:hypothetical protein